MPSVLIRLAILSSLGLLGCTSQPAAVATVQEVRELEPSDRSGEAPALILYRPQVWYQEAGRRTWGVRLPQGEYRYEGRDGDYSFYQAPDVIQRHMSDKGERLPGFVIGGLALAQNPQVSPPAALYITNDPVHRTLFWPLDKEFLGLEGQEWDRQKQSSAD